MDTLIMRSLFSQPSTSLALFLDALLTGITFLFRLFPAGPGKKSAAKTPGVSGSQKAATDNRWDDYAKPPATAKVDPVNLSDLASASDQKLPSRQESDKGFLPGDKLMIERSLITA